MVHKHFFFISVNIKETKSTEDSRVLYWSQSNDKVVDKSTTLSIYKGNISTINDTYLSYVFYGIDQYISEKDMESDRANI